MDIGNKLKELRKQQKLTLKELSQKTTISISFISDIENRRRNPSIDNLKILANALNVPVNYFFDGNEFQEETKLDEYINKNKIFFSKFEKLNDKDKDKIIKMIEMFEDETQD